MKVIHFPDNILEATLENWFNGHVAAVTQDTDMLQTNKYELAEIALFKNNVQGTAFIGANDEVLGGSTNYATLLPKLIGTGRISFGMYFNTDWWVNPLTGVFEEIPDYYSQTWTSKGVAAFKGAVLGAAKPTVDGIGNQIISYRYPNHGHQMYEISQGDYGYNFLTNTSGESNYSELKQSIDIQKTRLNNWGIKHSGFSFKNGRNDGYKLLIPYFLAGRNSDSMPTWGGTLSDAPITPFSLIRYDDINKSSSTRVWDSWYSMKDADNQPFFATIADAIVFMKQQIQRAITAGGWWSDFIHWHSLYVYNTPEMFQDIFQAIDMQIGSQDVWRAGYLEVAEYSYIKGLIDMVGSLERNGELYFYYRLKDKFKGTNTNGIANDVDLSYLSTPVSIRISTIGTSLAGKDITCEQATLIRKIDSNTWVISVPLISKTDEEVISFRVKQGSAAYYSNIKPAITRSGNTFTSTVPSKWVVWRKLTTDSLNTVREVSRDNVLKSSFTHTIETGYNYYVGAISKYGHSSLIEIEL